MESRLLLKMHLTCLIVFHKCDVLIRSYSAQILFYNFIQISRFLRSRIRYSVSGISLSNPYIPRNTCLLIQSTIHFNLDIANRKLAMSISETDYLKMVIESIME